MVQRLFVFLFFTGFAPLILSVPRKYFLIEEKKMWNDSQAYCRATYTDLAIIQNNDDLVQIQNEIQGKQFNSSAWIGLYNDINSWRWSIGNVPLGSFQKWIYQQPINWHGDDKCGIISAMGWSDLTCTYQAPFVCFDETKTGAKRYVFVKLKLGWSDAQRYCRQNNMDLASSRDETENQDIIRLTITWSWFGLFRDGWKWIDKTAFSTISWMPKTPNNALQHENCGYLNNSQAADALCTDMMPFICYLDPSLNTIKQQTMNIKVQSDQDPNDPALKLAILEQIKQKLKNYGLDTDITVKFLEKQNGKVFYKKN